MILALREVIALPRPSSEAVLLRGGKKGREGREGEGRERVSPSPVPSFSILKPSLDVKSLLISNIYTVSQKTVPVCYFLNNSVKHWPTLIIFGMQHREET